MVSVDSGVRWPADEHAVYFAGREIRLIPPQRGDRGQLRSYPMAVVALGTGEKEEETVGLIRRFLNALSWRDQAHLREVDVTYGAPLRTGVRVPDNFSTAVFNAEALVDPLDQKARIALAFYREGLNLRTIHRPYSFLSLFKVLNIRFPNGREQKAWINRSYNSLKHPGAGARLQELVATPLDVGDYLYESGRCAVAHAFAAPLVDPDNIGDEQRLSKDWVVIRALAALLIQTEWGILDPTGHSV